MRKRSISTLFGVSLISVAVLGLEIALTRVFSVLMWYRFAFMIISLALLGSGAACPALSCEQRELGVPLRTIAGFAPFPAFRTANTARKLPLSCWDRLRAKSGGNIP